MGIVVNLLSAGGYVLYNRGLASLMGVNVAILVGHLCRLREVKGNGFYYRQEDIADELALSTYEVRGALKKLADAGIVSTTLEGLPARIRYTINEDRLEEAVKTAFELKTRCEKLKELDVEKLDTKTSRSNATNNDKPLREEPLEVITPKRFVPPAVQEVKDYCTERKNGVNPQSFVDFYTSKGWVVGKSPMKDWRAAVRTWERTSSPAPLPPRQRKQDYE